MEQFTVKAKIVCTLCNRMIKLFGMSYHDIKSQALQKHQFSEVVINGKTSFRCKYCTPKTPISKPSINGILLHTETKTSRTNNANETRKMPSSNTAHKSL